MNRLNVGYLATCSQRESTQSGPSGLGNCLEAPSLLIDPYDREP
jgi:hypothetical protein